MDFAQVFKSLALDQWYKLLVLIGGLASLGGLFWEVKVLSNGVVLPISLGLFFIGLGEWASHRKAPYRRETGHGSRVSGWEMQRFNSIPGNVMTVIGLLLVAYGIYAMT
ncbi:MAG: hypothetical protein HUJ16_05900 [Kangiella sp.]|nr:hypothetical protein [Kangiella sp.]